MQSIKNAIKKTIFASVYIYFKNALRKSGSQSNESYVIAELLEKYKINKSFVEFGFSGWEFNCIELARQPYTVGLLIDGDPYNISISRQIFDKNIESVALWLDLNSLGIVSKFAENIGLGILSIDVDGNDYWFLEKLIDLRPSLIISEFNVALGHRPLTIPYDAEFFRFSKHPSGEYYGASLAALNYLCDTNGYSLVRISKNGVNAFFVRNDLIADANDKMRVAEIELRKFYPDGSIARSMEAWEGIKHLPFVDVTKPDASALCKGDPTI